MHCFRTHIGRIAAPVVAALLPPGRPASAGRMGPSPGARSGVEKVKRGWQPWQCAVNTLCASGQYEIAAMAGGAGGSAAYFFNCSPWPNPRAVHWGSGRPDWSVGAQGYVIFPPPNPSSPSPSPTASPTGHDCVHGAGAHPPRGAGAWHVGVVTRQCRHGQGRRVGAASRRTCGKRACAHAKSGVCVCVWRGGVEATGTAFRRPSSARAGPPPPPPPLARLSQSWSRFGTMSPRRSSPASTITAPSASVAVLSGLPRDSALTASTTSRPPTTWPNTV